MKIYIGADHKGFELKEMIKPWLLSQEHEIIDVGASTFDPNDDYPIYAENVGRNISESIQEKPRGIIICGSGVGVDIVANKFENARSGLGINSDQIKKARQDDDINILAIASDYINEQQAKEMIKAFLETPFDPSQKHTRRLDEIEEIEKKS